MTEQLKPCPFCGGKADTDEKLNGYQFQIICSRCLVSTDDCRTKDEAVSDWNNRVSATWINVDEQIPDNDSEVLLRFEEEGGYFSYGTGHYSPYTDDIEIVLNPYKNTVINYRLTHWMPIPKLAKDELS